MRYLFTVYLFKIALLVLIVPTADARLPSNDQPVIETLTIKTLNAWSPAEHWAWNKIREGKIADMSLASELEAGKEKSDGLACKPHKIKDGVPAHRLLSASFIQTVLLNPKLVEALEKPEVHIKCAYITQKIILEDEKVEPELFLEESYLTHGVNFISAKFSRRIGFGNSKVNGELNLGNAEVNAELFLAGSEYEKVYLVGSKIANNLRAFGIRACSTFSADDIQVSGSINLSRSHFYSDVSFVNASVKVDFWGAGIYAGSHFNLYKINIGKDLFLPENYNPVVAASFDNLSLGRANVGGNVNLSKIRVTNKVTADGIVIGGDLLINNAVFDQPREFKTNGEPEDSIALIDAYIGEDGRGGNVNINGIKVSSLFNAGGAFIAGNLYADEAVFEAGVNFVGVTVGDGFRALSVRSEGNFDLGLITIHDNLDLNPKKESNKQSQFTELNISSGSIGKSVNLRGAQISKNFDARKVEIGSDLILSGGVEVFGNHEDDVASVDLESAIVKGKVQLFGGTFNGRMDFAEAQLGALELGQPDSYRNQKAHPSVSWKSDVVLDLNNTQVGILRASLEAWKYNTGTSGENWVAAGLSNFHYRQVSRGLVGDHQSMIDASDAELLSWLENSFNKFKYQLWLSANKSSNATKFEDWVTNKNLTKDYLYYTPGAYQQLIETLNTQGMKSKADAITYRQRAKRYEFPLTEGQDSSPFLFQVKRWALWGIGYGVYPFRAFYAYAAIVFFGIICSFFSRDESGAFSEEQTYRQTSTVHRVAIDLGYRSLWYRCLYSAENSLPLVPMSTRFDGIKHHQTAVEIIFGFQKFLGFLFGSYLVGAFSLLIV